MKRPSRFQSAAFAAAAFVLLLAGGCARSRPGAPASEEAGENISLNTFMQQLRRQGVSVMQEGPAGGAVIADGMRLLVNDRELVDIYVFQNAAQAASQAGSVAATANRPFRVYQKNNILALRLTNRDASVGAALEDVLGPPRF